MINVYAVARGLTTLPPTSSVGGARLRTVPVADVVAVVGEEATGPVNEQAVAQGVAVEAIAELADALLPVRFGERFEDEEAVVSAVSARLAELQERLRLVEGCVELTVRVIAQPGDDPAGVAVDGAAYMNAKLADRRRKNALASELHEPLERRARASVSRRRLGDAFVHDASYLVTREDAQAFRDAVDRFGAAHPDLTVVCTGPWAPATFAAEPEA